MSFSDAGEEATLNSAEMFFKRGRECSCLLLRSLSLASSSVLRILSDGISLQEIHNPGLISSDWNTKFILLSQFALC